MNILCTADVREPERQTIRKAAAGCHVAFADANQIPDEALAQADVIFGLPPVSAIQKAKRLRWFHSTAAGVDKYLKDGVLDESVLLTNAFGIYADVQSESILAMLLAIVKRLPQYRDNQRETLWHDEWAVDSVSGSRALIVGFGSIGMALGKKLHALGARVVGVRRSNRSVPDYAEAVYTTERLPALLPNADLVILNLPATNDTAGLFDEAMFSYIKKGAYFVNAGRGSTVDTQALCNALDRGLLSGAALDVFEKEPLPADHPLWRYPNVLITPHVAGRDYMPAVYTQNIALFVENLERFLNGEELKYVIDRSLGYNRCTER